MKRKKTHQLFPGKPRSKRTWRVWPTHRLPWPLPANCCPCTRGHTSRHGQHVATCRNRLPAGCSDAELQETLRFSLKRWQRSRPRALLGLVLWHQAHRAFEPWLRCQAAPHSNKILARCGMEGETLWSEGVQIKDF